MKNFAQSLLDLWKHLGLNQRVSLIVAAIAVIGGLVGVVLWSQRPDYQLLYARLGEKDAAAVISISKRRTSRTRSWTAALPSRCRRRWFTS
jgi:flagellar M-ring protein FliF